MDIFQAKKLHPPFVNLFGLYQLQGPGMNDWLEKNSMFHNQ